MNYYRITKYNPAFRDEQGFYRKNDWTSISDVGQTFDDRILTIEEYKQIEDAYTKAVNIILQEKDILQLTVHSLEKNDCIEEHILSSKDEEFYIRIAELLQLDLENIEMAVRLALRELIWCTLSCSTKNVEIEFGYDYYMYIRCDAISELAQKKISEYGLFVEPLSENE